MTTLKLDTLSDRIKAHKTALIHIVKPPVCTERAQHYPDTPRAGTGPSSGGTHHLDQA